MQKRLAEQNRLTLGLVLVAALSVSLAGCAADTTPPGEESTGSTQEALSGIGSTPVAGQWVADPAAPAGEIGWIDIGARYQGVFNGVVEGGTAVALYNAATGQWSLSLRSGAQRRGYSVTATATTLVLSGVNGSSALVRK
jgi:hypothetical protein